MVIYSVGACLWGWAFYTTKIGTFVCLDNEETHFKTNFTVHFINFILNNLNESGHEYPKHRPDKHGSFCAAIWQITLYYIICSTDPYRHDGLVGRQRDWQSSAHGFKSHWGRLETFFNFLYLLYFTLLYFTLLYFTLLYFRQTLLPSASSGYTFGRFYQFYFNQFKRIGIRVPQTSPR